MSKAVFENIKKLLDNLDIQYKILKHKPVSSSKEAAKVRGVQLKQGVKAMVFFGDAFLMALVPGNKRVDVKKLNKASGKKLKLANPTQVLERTDCEIGSVPPLGHLKPLKTFMDQKILENKTVDFNAGLHEVSIQMSAKDLKTALEKTTQLIVDKIS